MSNGATGQEFARANKEAMMFQHQAANDYIESRCLLLNLFFGGLAHGATAIEKFLKALILFTNPETDIRSLSHHLPELINHQTLQAAGIDLSRFASSAERFESHYKARYPDNPEFYMGKSSEELSSLDEFALAVSDALPIPMELRPRTGLYAKLTLPDNPITSQQKYWLTQNNPGLKQRCERLGIQL